MKYLLIGDLHLDDKHPGYLDAQVEYISSIMSKYNSVREDRGIIFLGDIFDKRSPSPSVLLAFRQILRSVRSCNWTNILRGNHDSETKADDGITALSLFDEGGEPWSQVAVATHITEKGSLLFIPHYEKQDKIIEALKNADPSQVIFGHFGFFGTTNSRGDYDCSIPINSFNNITFLGHIHQYSTTGMVTVVGTPYTTSYFESGKPNYLIELDIDGDNVTWEKVPSEGGIRHLVYKYKDLEENRDNLYDPRYYTLLRVILDPKEVVHDMDFIRKIKEEYKVDWVDIKIESSVNDDNKENLSSYVPKRELHNINNQVIEDYLDENKTSIPKEDLLKGLNAIKNN